MNSFFQSCSPRELVSKLPLYQIALRCLAETSVLGIPDLLEQAGSMTIEELASKAKADPDVLYRVMRVLASVDFYEELGDKVFINSEATSLLVSSKQKNLKNCVDIAMAGEHYEALSQLGECLAHGKSTFVKQHGSKFWELWEKNPARGKQFNDYMRELSEPGIEHIAKAYPFHEYKTIVDVGGGVGHLLEGVLQAAPMSNGILFELPAVIADALKKKQEGSAVALRCTLEEGDMFSSVVAGGDLYMMKRVLHDWDDENCMKILKNVQKQLKPSSKLLIIDAVVTQENAGFDPNKFLDITMMTLLGSRERTETEFRLLAQKSGLSVTRIIHVPAAQVSLIECEAASS